MIRILICLILLGGAAMAAPLETPNYDPMKQRVTPNGTAVPEDAEPTDQEMMLWMWKRFAGDKPMPESLRKKYGLPPEAPPIRPGK